MIETLTGRRQLAGLAAMAGAGALLAAGCGYGGKSTEAAPKDPQVCRAEYPVDWVSTPPVFKAGEVARILGVSVEQVTNGSVGLADCPVEIAAYQVGQEVVSVAGYGDRCLPVEIDDANGTPLADVNDKSHYAFALCAADGPST